MGVQNMMANADLLRRTAQHTLWEMLMSLKKECRANYKEALSDGDDDTAQLAYAVMLEISRLMASLES